MNSEENVLAKLISKFFEPMIVFMAISLIGAWHLHLRGVAYSLYVLYILGIAVLMSAVRVRLMRVMHTNWDISNRAKRVPVLGLLVAFCFLLYFSTMLWRTMPLTHLFALFLLWMVGFFLITLRIKISGHMAVLTLAIGLLVSWYEISLWMLGVLVPLLGWSRVKLRRHSVIEVVLGTAYSLGVLYLYNRLAK